MTSEDFSGEMVLLEAKAKPARKVPDGMQPAPFTLYFRYVGDPFPPQGTYTFANAATGDIEIFVAPVSREPGGVVYEAVFN